jgi:mannose-6-phosphate isomerase-like protein (cupin superfamily)
MLHFQAWELGIKSLYYLRSKSVQRAGFAGGVEADNTPTPPSSRSAPPGELSGAGVHSTNTIDYLTVVSGEIVLITETGEVTCRAGDMIVDRGVLHGWRNDGAETALVSCVMIDAAPVGKGATHT